MFRGKLEILNKKDSENKTAKKRRLIDSNEEMNQAAANETSNIWFKKTKLNHLSCQYRYFYYYCIMLIGLITNIEYKRKFTCTKQLAAGL